MSFLSNCNAVAALYTVIQKWNVIDCCFTFPAFSLMKKAT